MIRLISNKLIFPGLAAVLLLPNWFSNLSAQNTAKAATVISDVQAQALPGDKLARVLAHPMNPERHRRENQRDDDHLDRLNESSADWL